MAGLPIPAPEASLLYGPNGRPLPAATERAMSLEEFVQYYTTGGELRQEEGDTGAASAFSRQAFVYACVAKIATACASTPGYLKRWSDGEPEERHPLARRLAHPAPRRAWYELVEHVAASLKLFGDAILFMDFGGAPARGKVPNGIVPLATPRVTVHEDDDEEPLFYEYTTKKGRKEKFLPSEIIHVHTFSPTDDNSGVAAFSAAKETVAVDRKLIAYVNRFLRNAAQPSAALTHKGQVTTPLLKEVRREVNERHAGLENAGSVLILGGDWQWQKMGASISELAMGEVNDRAREELAAVFGVPPIMLGRTEGIPLALGRIMMRLFRSMERDPILVRFEGAIESQLLDPYFQEFYYEFDKLGGPGADEDLYQKIESAGVLIDKRIATPNEAIDFLQLPFEKRPEGDEHLVAFGMTTASSIVEMADQPVEPDDDEEPDDSKPADDEAAKDSGRHLLEDDEMRAVYWRAFAHTVERLSAPMRRDLRAHFSDLMEETLAKLAKSSPPYVRTAKRGAVEDWIAKVTFQLDDAKKKIRGISKAYGTDAAKKGGSMVLAELGLDSSFETLSSLSLDALYRRENLIARTDERIWEDVKAALRASLEDGDSLDEMAENLRSHIFSPEASRARMIARTEVGTAVQFGRADAMAQEGIEKNEWISAKDEHVREPPDSKWNHAIDGEVVKLGETFSTGLRWPLDDESPGSEAGNIINCLPGDQRVSGAVLGASKAFYAGPLVEIETEVGHRLTVTVNHPILTPRGFIPAGMLREGDDLLCEPLEIHGRPARWDVKDQDRPPTIEQVFEALRVQGAPWTFRPGIRDLYGDARFFKGEVEIVEVVPASMSVVASDRMLLAVGDAVSREENRREFGFIESEFSEVGRTASPVRFPGRARTDEMCVGVRMGDSRLAPAQRIGLATCPEEAASLSQPLVDNRRAHAETDAQRRNTIASVERCEHLVGVDRRAPAVVFDAHRLGASANLEPRFSYPSTDGRRSDVQLACELQRRYAGRVTGERIRALRRRDFIGPVYDLHTQLGYFAAGANATILLRNCRCSTLPVID